MEITHDLWRGSRAIVIETRHLLNFPTHYLQIAIADVFILRLQCHEPRRKLLRCENSSDL